MTQSASITEIYTPAVCEILDLYYDREGEEPDWAAIKTRLFTLTDSSYSVTLNLLRALWAIYEDTAAWETLQLHLKVVREAE